MTRGCGGLDSVDGSRDGRDYRGVSLTVKIIPL